MNLIQKLKDTIHERKVQSLIQKGKFDQAVRHISEISSLDRQKKIIAVGLFDLAAALAAESGLAEIVITTDRQEYDRFQALVGKRGKKYMLYLNSETGLIERGQWELVEEYFPPTNPLLEYLNKISQTSQ